MRFTRIIAAAAAPLAIGGLLLATAGQASAVAAGLPSSSDVSAYFYNPSGNALGGPQAMGPFGTAHVSFGSQYLALVAENANNLNLLGNTVTITGHLDPGTSVQYQGYPDGSGIGPSARVWFNGAGGVSSESPQGYEGQQWWATWGSPAVLDLNNYGSGEFSLTITVSPSGWSDYNGKQASDNADLFNKAASRVQQLGLSFGGGYFFKNGVAGSGGITIDSITIG